MKPHRIRMAHNLLLNYGLYRKMEIYRPSSASFEELCKFHSADYVRFLRDVTPENMAEPMYRDKLEKHNICEDCPIFDGLYEYQNYTPLTFLLSGLVMYFLKLPALYVAEHGFRVDQALLRKVELYGSMYMVAWLGFGFIAAASASSV